MGFAGGDMESTVLKNNLQQDLIGSIPSHDGKRTLENFHFQYQDLNLCSSCTDTCWTWFLGEKLTIFMQILTEAERKIVNVNTMTSAE